MRISEWCGTLSGLLLVPFAASQAVTQTGLTLVTGQLSFSGRYVTQAVSVKNTCEHSSDHQNRLRIFSSRSINRDRFRIYQQRGVIVGRIHGCHSKKRCRRRSCSMPAGDGAVVSASPNALYQAAE